MNTTILKKKLIGLKFFRINKLKNNRLTLNFYNRHHLNIYIKNIYNLLFFLKLAIVGPQIS